MGTVTVSLPPRVYTSLHSHLLAKNASREQAAFVFARLKEAAGSEVFECLDWMLVEQEEFSQQCGDYLELSDRSRAKIIKRAHDLNASIVEFHSHLGPWPAVFSQADKEGLEEFVPHVWWRLKHRPYAAIVVAASGFDGLVWLNDPSRPQQLDGIRVGQQLLEPTRLSLPRWRSSAERFDRNGGPKQNSGQHCQQR